MLSNAFVANRHRYMPADWINGDNIIMILNGNTSTWVFMSVNTGEHQ